MQYLHGYIPDCADNAVKFARWISLNYTILCMCKEQMNLKSSNTIDFTSSHTLLVSEHANSSCQPTWKMNFNVVIIMWVQTWNTRFFIENHKKYKQQDDAIPIYSMLSDLFN